MLGLSRAPLSSAVRAPGRAPTHVGSRVSRSVARDFVAHARIARSSRAGRRNGRKKRFCSDYPRRLINCVWLWWFPALDALPVAPALTVPLLLAHRRLAVSLLCFPPRPFPCRLPAALAAITLACLPRMKALLTSFQQATPHPRPSSQSFAPTLLIFGMTCRTLGRAHGR
jgi:hypothetical protein